MNDERFLKDWLEDEAPDASGAPERSAQIMARLPEVKQKRRRWPFALAGGAPAQPTDRRDRPNVSGRTRLMFSPAKSVIAGALVFAVGGALFLTQPFADADRTGPAAESPDTGSVTVFEGTMGYGSDVQTGTVEPLPSGAIATRGQIWEVDDVEMSDPRLNGVVQSSWNWDAYPADASTIWHGEFRITNDDGAWQMRPMVNLSIPDVSFTVWTAIFDGEGAYEGLTAIAEVTEEDFGYQLQGVVMDGEIPPAPAPMQ